jgi:hypothetical protein
LEGGLRDAVSVDQPLEGQLLAVSSGCSDDGTSKFHCDFVRTSPTAEANERQIRKTTG